METPDLPPHHALRRRFAWSLLAALAIVTMAPVAWGHSFERSFASARYAERLDAENLHVLVVVELPSLDVLGDFRRYLRDHPGVSDEENTERFRRAQLQSIAESFSLEVNGDAVSQPWRVVENPANGLGDADFFVYMIEHKRPTPGGERVTLELENRLHPAKVVFMSSRADADDGWRVDEDSAVALLADGMEGEVVGPDVDGEASGKWSSNEAMRQLRVVFERGDAASSTP